MKAKDWLALALFVVATAAAVLAVVVVMSHQRTRHRVLYTPAQRRTLNSCLQNPGNGGC